jgi:hypothetical protein
MWKRRRLGGLTVTGQEINLVEAAGAHCEQHFARIKYRHWNVMVKA